MRRQYAQHLLSAFGLALLGVCVWFLQHELRTIDFQRVLTHAWRLPTHQLVLAGLLVIGGYGVTLGYDFLALRYIGRPLRAGVTVFISFISTAFSNSISLPVLNVGGVRLRLYRRWDIPSKDIAQLVVFIGISAWFGLLLMASVSVFYRVPPMPWDLATPLVQAGGRWCVHCSRGIWFFAGGARRCGCGSGG